MNRFFKLFLSACVIALMVFPGYPIFMEVVFSECGLTKEFSLEQVDNFLKNKGLDKQWLRSDSNNGSCSYSYEYESNTDKYSIVVMSTLLHGVKLNYLNLNDRPQN
ncbi:MAG: hypothetical protein CL674_02935 [Bdellovibrionaceae bacterium]|nr:hypothetical protein [Pseudobdellovibrionaceae bacterium]